MWHGACYVTRRAAARRPPTESAVAFVTALSARSAHEPSEEESFVSEILTLIFGTAPVILALTAPDGCRQLVDEARLDVAQRLPLAYDLVIHGC